MSTLGAVKRCVTALLILGAVVTYASDPPDDALKHLSTIGIFAFGGVGYAGATSKGEIDFKLILAQPPMAALAAFEKLYATGNPQGKSYALSGIKKLNPSRFKDLLALAGRSSEDVQVEKGCIIAHEQLRDVAKQIDRGKFRF
jgi:hypothetical protein